VLVEPPQDFTLESLRHLPAMALLVEVERAAHASRRSRHDSRRRPSTFLQRAVNVSVSLVGSSTKINVANSTLNPMSMTSPT
jgi:hypothetical protein